MSNNIESFAENELDPKEEEQFLEKKYQDHYDGKLKNRWAQELKAKHNISRVETQTQKNRPSGFRKIIPFVAGIAALFLVGFFIMQLMSGSNESIQQMATSMISIEKMDIKRGGQERDVLMKQIKESFNLGKWDEAINLFDEISNPNSEDLYFEGLAQFYNKDYQNTIATFKEIPDSETFNFSAEKKWYQSLAYIFTDQNDQAKILLEDMAKSNWKSREAKKLLKQIE